MKKVKFNSSFAYSHPSNGMVKIISLEQDDNKVFTIKGLSAEVFLKIVNGEDEKQIFEFIKSQENSPPAEAINSFLEKFVDDLTQLNLVVPV